MSLCHDAYCWSKGNQKYCGFCPVCWIHLTPEKRMILLGEQAPVQVVQKTVYEAKPNYWFLTLIWFLCTLGGVVAGNYICFRLGI